VRTRCNEDNVIGHLHPHRAVGADAQHVADAPLLQPLAQLGIDAVDLIASHPARRHTGLEGGGDHLHGQGRFGGELDLVGNTGGRTALRVLAPVLGQIQSPVDQRVPGRGRIRQIHRQLGDFDPAGGAAVLALHPHGGGALLDITGLVDLCRRRHRLTYAEPGTMPSRWR
jgi:hypothetical protein